MKKKIGEVDSFVVPRKDFENIMRLISSIVVSLDQIGSSYDLVGNDEDYNQMVEDYLIDWSIFRTLAKARHIMSEIYDREFTSEQLEAMEDEWDAFPNWRWSIRKPPKAWDDFAINDLGVNEALYRGTPDDDEDA
mgnify:CR=1 FL=1